MEGVADAVVARSPSPEPTSEASKEETARASPEEPFAGNVSQYTPVPPGGESRKKGLLRFDACFEGGAVVNGNHCVTII
jgi:hypothetical protein